MTALAGLLPLSGVGERLAQRLIAMEAGGEILLNNSGTAVSVSTGIEQTASMVGVCGSTTTRRSAPAFAIASAATRTPKACPERVRRSWLAYPKYGTTAVTRAARARRHASSNSNNSTRWSPTGGAVGCTTYTSFPQT